jgi:hypothetical protein
LLLLASKKIEENPKSNTEHSPLTNHSKECTNYEQATIGLHLAALAKQFLLTPTPNPNARQSTAASSSSSAQNSSRQSVSSKSAFDAAKQKLSEKVSKSKFLFCL